MKIMTDFNIKEFMSKYDTLNATHNWISALPISQNSIQEIARNFYSQHTHQGLIWYLYYCIALSKISPLTIIVRPDMIWFTILSEISVFIKNDMEAFTNLFDTKDVNKEMFSAMDNGSAIDINELTSKMRSCIKNSRFFQLLTETRFESEPPLANYNIRTLFCTLKPVRKTGNKNCQITVTPNSNTNITFEKSKKDWIVLYKSVEKLEMFHNNNEEFATYIKTCKSVIAKIITNKNSSKFANDIFHYVHNPNDGGDSYIVQGWARMLYMNYDKNTLVNLSHYNIHLSYIPYKHLATGEMFCQMAGLTYSDLSENTTTIFEPQYGIVKFKINDERVFRQLQHDGLDTAGAGVGIGVGAGETNFDIRLPQQTHLQTYDRFQKDVIHKQIDSYKDNHIMPMNPISSFPQAKGTSPFLMNDVSKMQHVSDIHPDMRHTHELNTIPPPQSVLFELKEPQDSVGKTYGGEYTSVFQRDNTIPMLGGSMPQE